MRGAAADLDFLMRKSDAMNLGVPVGNLCAAAKRPGLPNRAPAERPLCRGCPRASWISARGNVSRRGLFQVVGRIVGGDPDRLSQLGDAQMRLSVVKREERTIWFVVQEEVPLQSAA